MLTVFSREPSHYRQEIGGAITCCGDIRRGHQREKSCGFLLRRCAPCWVALILILGRLGEIVVCPQFPIIAKNSLVTQRRLNVILILVLMALWFVATKNWMFAFVKLGEMRIPYMVFYSGLLIFGLWLISLRQINSLFKMDVIGVFVGQLAGTISLMFANLFIPNGIERNLSSFEREGFLNLILVDSSVAFILGGWLLGGVVFVVFSWMKKQGKRATH